MLNDDVISIIKEYAGITSLDIVNAFYELKRIISDEITYLTPNINRIQTLLKWIPILYKPSKKCRISDYEQDILEDYIGDQVSTIDTVIAFKLLFPMKIIKDIPMFQATRNTSNHIAKYIKKELNFVSPLYKIRKKIIYYMEGIVNDRLVGQCLCGKTKRLDDYYNGVMTCRGCINKSVRHILKQFRQKK